MTGTSRDRRRGDRFSFFGRCFVAVSQGFTMADARILDLNEEGARIVYGGQPPLDNRMALTCFFQGRVLKIRMHLEWAQCYRSHSIMVGARFIDDMAANPDFQDFIRFAGTLSAEPSAA